MKKVLDGKIVSLKSKDTAIVEVERKVAHPLYKKLMKKTKKYKVDVAGLALNLGDRVKIVATRPISKQKHFRILEGK
ncbi:MAG: 30S ribosomal protein S17 [Candidatus Levybacteria bacterium]|nr:30S ribosomal protein S17 [Candidatus Levybacteria bacterium]